MDCCNQSLVLVPSGAANPTYHDHCGMGDWEDHQVPPYPLPEAVDSRVPSFVASFPPRNRQ